MQVNGKIWWVLAVGIALLSTGPAPAAASDLKELEGLGVTEHLNDQIPLDLRFKNERGNMIRLGDYFDGQMPVILSLNYSNCPLLCQQQLNGLVFALKQIEGNAGEDFRVVSISIDPLETATRARESKNRYFREYGRAGTGDGWNFLVGDVDAIQAIVQATGFTYRYMPDTKEYIHPAVMVLCTPDGRISRYLYGVEFDPKTLRLSLVEASDGKIGTTVEQFLLFCFHYDETAGKYGPHAFKIMQLGGLTTVVCLMIGLIPVWLRSWRQRKQTPQSRGFYSPQEAGSLPSRTR